VQRERVDDAVRYLTPSVAGNHGSARGRRGRTIGAFTVLGFTPKGVLRASSVTMNSRRHDCALAGADGRGRVR
jgi:hypothetical protein